MLFVYSCHYIPILELFLSFLTRLNMNKELEQLECIPLSRNNVNASYLCGFRNCHIQVCVYEASV